MKIITETIWKCDLCGNKVKSSCKTKPAGWRGVSIGIGLGRNNYTDCCCDCVEKIKNLVEQLEKKGE